VNELAGVAVDGVWEVSVKELQKVLVLLILRCSRLVGCNSLGGPSFIVTKYLVPSFSRRLLLVRERSAEE
jgi:hypothetical protein